MIATAGDTARFCCGFGRSGNEYGIGFWRWNFDDFNDPFLCNRFLDNFSVLILDRKAPEGANVFAFDL